MKKHLFLQFLLVALLWSVGMEAIAQKAKKPERTQNYVEANFNKQEYQIEMRDGIKLHTTVYSPKDNSKKYPILLKRTPYSCRPYGTDKFPSKIAPNEFLMKDGYIVVYQDVRGRWNSEGDYDNMRPHVPNKKSNKDIDESSDTYDSVDWLVKNVKNNNGKVGVWGISYPGFYATTSAIEAHPAVKAISPQAPIGDFYFDDFHHNGAYLLSYWRATAVFGYQSEPTTQSWYKVPDIGTPDAYEFFLNKGPLSNLDAYYGEDNFFWQDLKTHPDYDEFWQKRGIIQHLNDVKPAMMIVGGWFDAEDLYGPLNTYKAIEKNNPKTYNTIVMGPWSHGDWVREKKRQAVGNVYFGDSISTFFQKDLEHTFFTHFLKGKGKGKPALPEACMFDTGNKTWGKFDVWPPENTESQTWYLRANEKLSTEAMGRGEVSSSEFISDPNKPVPFTEDIKTTFTPRKYMTDDQRFAGRRPDVLVFETDVLEEPLTLVGDILAQLKVSTTGTDADWIVKVIDVYPPDHKDYEETQDHLRMGGYEMMVRSEVLRGRYRNDFAKPEPFTPNEVTDVNIQLQDVYHTFKKGHKVMIQVQSTWFPYIDRNPQTYVDNIFEAEEKDFQRQTHKVHHAPNSRSSIEVKILKK